MPFKIFELTTAFFTYALGALCSTVVGVFLFTKDLPVRGYILTALVVLGFWAALAYYIYSRWKYKKSIVARTKHGVNVRLAFAGSLTETQLLEISEWLDNTVQFWTDLYPQEVDYIRNSLYGTTITITDTNPKIVDLSGATKLLRGMQLGDDVTVVWNDKTPWDVVLKLVKHEFSHLILEHIGIDPGFLGVEHHKLFVKVNLGC